MSAAPTGDGGLREALDSLCKDHEAEAEGGGFTDIDTIWPSQIREVLDAHPAAPAVPQPAAREALRKLMRDALDAYVNLGPQGYWVYLDSIAAVLAGEQEQAGGVEHQTITNPDAVRRCPARGYANEPCIRPDLHDGSHEWREQEQVEP